MRQYFKWTPEAVEKLAELAPVKSALEIANILGCTRNAVTSKLYDQGIGGRKTTATGDVRRYMERYQVSRRKVECAGVSRLNAMTEDAQKLLLGIKMGIAVSPSRVKKRIYVPALRKQPNAERIEKMLYLAKRIA